MHPARPPPETHHRPSSCYLSVKWFLKAGCFIVKMFLYICFSLNMKHLGWREETGRAWFGFSWPRAHPPALLASSASEGNASQDATLPVLPSPLHSQECSSPRPFEHSGEDPRPLVEGLKGGAMGQENTVGAAGKRMQPVGAQSFSLPVLVCLLWHFLNQRKQQ